MKSWKCPWCKHEIETEDNIKVLMCGCGEYMEAVSDDN